MFPFFSFLFSSLLFRFPPFLALVNSRSRAHFSNFLQSIAYLGSREEMNEHIKRSLAAESDLNPPAPDNQTRRRKERLDGLCTRRGKGAGPRGW
jgi:hypothetical protein